MTGLLRFYFVSLCQLYFPVAIFRFGIRSGTRLSGLHIFKYQQFKPLTLECCTIEEFTGLNFVPTSAHSHARSITGISVDVQPNFRKNMYSRCSIIVYCIKALEFYCQPKVVQVAAFIFHVRIFWGNFLCFINNLYLESCRLRMFTSLLAKSSRFFPLTSLPSLKNLKWWLYNFPFRYKSSKIGRSCSKQTTNKLIKISFCCNHHKC